MTIKKYLNRVVVGDCIEQMNKLPSESVDLIFADQPNLIIESGIFPSIYTTCHHQIIYATISFKIQLPSPYEREV